MVRSLKSCIRLDVPVSSRMSVLPLPDSSFPWMMEPVLSGICTTVGCCAPPFGFPSVPWVAAFKTAWSAADMPPDAPAPWLPPSAAAPASAEEAILSA